MEKGSDPSDFPISIQGNTIPIDVVVTDAHTYSAIVGNDWLAKVKANIDYESSIMHIYWQDQELEIPVEYLEMPHERRRKQEEKVKEIKEEEIEEESEETEEGGKRI
jgi:hypothetical protein